MAPAESVSIPSKLGTRRAARAQGGRGRAPRALLAVSRSPQGGHQTLRFDVPEHEPRGGLHRRRARDLVAFVSRARSRRPRDVLWGGMTGVRTRVERADREIAGESEDEIGKKLGHKKRGRKKPRRGSRAHRRELIHGDPVAIAQRRTERADLRRGERARALERGGHHRVRGLRAVL